MVTAIVAACLFATSCATAQSTLSTPANKAGDAEALAGKDTSWPVALIRRAAEQGDAEAQFLLGRLYADGTGVPQDDAEALRWFGRAAEQGNAEALRWFRRAGQQGDAEAQFLLGRLYADGAGVPQDDAEALQWIRLAAQQGSAEALRWIRRAAGARIERLPMGWTRSQGSGNFSAEAQFLLGRLYADGTGVPQDDAEAALWFRRAAGQGNAEALRWLRRAGGQGNGDAQPSPATVPGNVTDTVAVWRPNPSGDATQHDLPPDGSRMSRLTENGNDRVTVGADEAGPADAVDSVPVRQDASPGSTALYDLQFSEGRPEAGFMLAAAIGALPQGTVQPIPAFSAEVTSYALSVADDLVTIRAHAVARASFAVAGTAADGSALQAVNQFSIGNMNDHGAFLSVTLGGLEMGENTITLTVSDENETVASTTATIVATRTTGE